MTYRIGVDVGGTFTDFTVAQGDGALLLWKEDTTPEDPGVAVLAGLNAVAEQLTLFVPGALPQMIRDILHKAGEDVLAFRR